MKTIILSSLALFSSLAFKAQTTQSRDAKPFSKIEISGAANLVYTQSDTLAIKVTAD